MRTGICRRGMTGSRFSHRRSGSATTLALRAGEVRSRRVCGAADGVAVDDEFDAAVALTAFGCVVRSDRLRFAEAACSDGRAGHALLGQKITHGVGTALGELLVEFLTADAVRVALDLEREARMREKDARNFCQLFAGPGLQRVAAGGKEHVGHVHDEAAGGIARLQNGIQLREKLSAELSLFGFSLGSSLARFFGVSLGSGLITSGLFGGGLRGGSFVGRFLRFGFGGLLLR